MKSAAALTSRKSLTTLVAPSLQRIPAQQRRFANDQTNSSSSNNTSNTALLSAAAAASLAALVAQTNQVSSQTHTTKCDAPNEKPTQVEYSEKLNPFWPSGVNSKEVDILVDECLKDESINIAALPDYLERQIYSATIRLTLNLIYQVLGQLHGTSVLAHEIQLQRLVNPHEPERTLKNLRDSLDEEILEKVADRMMANKAVNQSLVPDFMERQLYVNCLKIVFRLLDMISSSLCVSVCGHTFRLTIEKQEDFMATIAETAAKQRNMATPVDTQLLMEFAAEQAGIDMEATDKQRWWFQRLMEPNPGKAFVAQLHASLYSLLLGILDDLLEQTQLELLSDQVTFDIVAVPESIRFERAGKEATTTNTSSTNKTSKPTVVRTKQAIQSSARSSSSSSSGGDYLPLACFISGVGVGLSLMGAAAAAAASKK